MSKAYGIISDLHLHNWTAFSTTSEAGFNSRLVTLFDEIERACKVLCENNGQFMFIAGDIFHVRGSITPSVLNVALDSFNALKAAYGVEFVAIPGNHDLESKSVKHLTNAVNTLRAEISIANWPLSYSAANRHVVLVPWIEDLNELKKTLYGYAESFPESVPKSDLATKWDLIIHAPINGVIPGLHETGLDPEWLGMLGFRNVFAGHYHNHKYLGHGVYSIGSIAHHTWSDVGSKAGFLIVHEDGQVQWHASHAPHFLSRELPVDDEEADANLLLAADGNYVRLTVPDTVSMSDVEHHRARLIAAGAKGVSIAAVRAPEASRDGEIVDATRSLATSGIDIGIGTTIKAFIDRKYGEEEELFRTNVTRYAAKIMNTVRATAKGSEGAEA